MIVQHAMLTYLALITIKPEHNGRCYYFEFYGITIIVIHSTDIRIILNVFLKSVLSHVYFKSIYFSLKVSYLTRFFFFLSPSLSLNFKVKHDFSITVYVQYVCVCVYTCVRVCVCMHVCVCVSVRIHTNSLRNIVKRLL